MRQDRKKLWRFSFVLIVFFFIFTSISFVNNEPWTIGDGYEYVIQTASFQNHLSYGMTRGDVDLAKEQFPEISEMLEWTYERMATGSNGLRYSNHFGIYSAIVTPIKIMILALGGNPIYAFRITNLLLWLAASLVVLFFLEVDDIKKLGLISLLLFNPAFFYVTWIHTELYIFSFTVMGLVFYYNKKYSLGILFVSIAAMQNLAVIPLAMAFGLHYIRDLYVGYKMNRPNDSFITFILHDWKKIIPYGALYIPAVIPMITCYSHFGVINRVAEVAMEDKYLLSKIKDYLFDLNIGILPYAPIILVAFFVLIIRDIFLKKDDSWFSLLAVAGMLFVVSFQQGINCGMEAIMRYNVWILPAMIFYVALKPDIETKNARYLLICGIESIFTLFMIVNTLWGGWKDEYYSYLQFSPMAKFALNNFPALYNPCHSIFYSRVGGEEKYYYEVPISYVNEDGYLRKTLLSSKAESVFYDERYVLVDRDGSKIDKAELKPVVVDDGEFKYINYEQDIFFAVQYILGERLLFTNNGYNVHEYIVKGLSKDEEWGSWTEGDELDMKFFVNSDAPDILTFYCDVTGGFYTEQSVKVIVNDALKFEGIVNGEEDDISFNIEKPQDGVINVKFLLLDSVQPSAVIDSGDARDLGIGLRSMQISAVK